MGGIFQQRPKSFQASPPVSWPSTAGGGHGEWKKLVPWFKDCLTPCGNWPTQLVCTSSIRRAWRMCGRCNRSIYPASKIHPLFSFTQNWAPGYRRETRFWMYWGVAEGPLLWKAFIATSALLFQVNWSYKSISCVYLSSIVTILEFLTSNNTLENIKYHF